MPKMRILPITTGRTKGFLVTILKTGEEAGDPSLNTRTAGDSWHGVWPNKDEASPLQGKGQGATTRHFRRTTGRDGSRRVGESSTSRVLSEESSNSSRQVS